MCIYGRGQFIIGRHVFRGGSREIKWGAGGRFFYVAARMQYILHGFDLLLRVPLVRGGRSMVLGRSGLVLGRLRGCMAGRVRLERGSWVFASFGWELVVVRERRVEWKVG